MNANIDTKTVDGFGDEWTRFDQSSLTQHEHQELFDRYFAIFPWDKLSSSAVGFDLGCGSGRWASLVAPRVGTLHCIDPSNAIEVAKKNLAGKNNCVFHRADSDSIPLEDASVDFGYSLGVLHHIPNTAQALSRCVAKLKPGAPFLVYLYYSFDNKPFLFRLIWAISDVIRRAVSRLPHALRYVVSQCIAFGVYYPLAKISWMLEKCGMNVSNIPLSAYRNQSVYTMRTDALDRFGTRLEQRFSRQQIQEMMQVAGLERIVFSENIPFWCAVGYKKI